MTVLPDTSSLMRIGYHLWLPVCRWRGAAERTWPASVLKSLMAVKLREAGLELKPGVLELWPAGASLRAPCGLGSVLLEPENPDHADDLRLRAHGVTERTERDWRTGKDRTVIRRNIGQLATAFCDAIDERRRPLEEWLGLPESPWKQTWEGTRATKKNRQRISRD